MTAYYKATCKTDGCEAVETMESSSRQHTVIGMQNFLTLLIGHYKWEVLPNDIYYCPDCKTQRRLAKVAHHAAEISIISVYLMGNKDLSSEEINEAKESIAHHEAQLTEMGVIHE